VIIEQDSENVDEVVNEPKVAPNAGRHSRKQLFDPSASDGTGEDDLASLRKRDRTLSRPIVSLLVSLGSIALTVVFRWKTTKTRMSPT
jgi:hypothetical protein